MYLTLFPILFSFSVRLLPCLWQEYSFYFPSSAENLCSLWCLLVKGKFCINVNTIWGKGHLLDNYGTCLVQICTQQAKLVRFPDQAICQADCQSDLHTSTSFGVFSYLTVKSCCSTALKEVFRKV